MEKDYIPIDTYIAITGHSRKNILQSINKPTDYNWMRFKKVDNQIYVHHDFYAPLKNKLHELLEESTILAHNEFRLCRELSILSKGQYKEKTLRRYFQRYSFKQIQKALNIINLLETYIQKNSLFPKGTLNGY